MSRFKQWDGHALPTPDYLYSVVDNWERFLANEPVETPTVRKVIWDSWLRSRGQGVDPFRKAAREAVAEAELSRVRARSELLVKALSRKLPLVTSRLNRCKGALIVAADSQGIVLSVDGTRNLVERLCALWSSPGWAWNEGSFGTNAIGTALALGQSVYIHEQEHFCEADKELTCLAGLVRDPFDEHVIGVINITTVDSEHVVELRVLLDHLLREINDQVRLTMSAEWEAIKRSFARSQRRGAGLLAFDRYGRVVQSEGLDQLSSAVQVAKHLQGFDAEMIRDRRTAALPEWIAAESIDWFSNGTGGLIYVSTASRPRRARADDPLATPFQEVADASPSLTPLLKRLQRYSARRMPILLQGETGSGKDVIAKAIHAASRGTAAPFVAINCAALPRELVASELFGHTDGAFTGSRRGGAKGRFEDAHGGSIFLDEIGEMPLETQPHLLRVLEEKEVARVGEAKARRIDVQVIAATNRPLEEDMKQGRFRSDLYFRLNCGSLLLPPLRDRKEDIEALIPALLTRILRPGEPVPTISAELLHRLTRCNWPGNVRELRNVLECLVAASPDGRLECEDLPPEFDRQSPVQPALIAGRVESMERELIIAALQRARGEVGVAAAELGLSRATVYRRLAQYEALHELSAFRNGGKPS